MKKENHDFVGAFRQIFILLTIITWIGWLYMFLTGTNARVMQTASYGRYWFDTVNANGMLFLALLVTIFTVSLFFIKKPNKK